MTAKLRTKEIPADNLRLGSVFAGVDMESFFDSLNCVLNGSYRRLTIDIKNKWGDIYTVTIYRCGTIRTNRFVRCDFRKVVFATNELI